MEAETEISPPRHAEGMKMKFKSNLQEEHSMQIQVHTDHNIEGHQALIDHVSGVVERALNRVSEHITRVEVHLSDVNGDKSGPNDKRCMMEARLEGRQPVAVTHQAATLEQAVDDAADKLTRLIESTLGRRSDQANRRTDPSGSTGGASSFFCAAR
jgi:ribosome-associated translation inhibitor RaiA